MDRRSRTHELGWRCKGEGEARDCPVADEVDLAGTHRLVVRLGALINIAGREFSFWPTPTTVE